MISKIIIKGLSSSCLGAALNEIKSFVFEFGRVLVYEGKIHLCLDLLKMISMYIIIFQIIKIVQMYIEMRK